MLAARRALVSVYDKRGLAELAAGLSRLGVEIVSTGGTLKYLAEREVPVVPVAEVTGFPEILDGRVKTLHPRIHGGILADRSRAAHAGELAAHGIAPIDLVVANLYPFRQTLETPGATPEQVIEMIDVGGPAMVRAAAKNHAGVAVVVDPDDYQDVLAALETHGGVVPEEMRRRLAAKAFRHTAGYDAEVAAWMERGAAAEGGEGLFPPRLALDLERVLEPRYGENPHQPAAVYRVAGPSGNPAGVFGGFEQLQGKDLSWNNLLDADAARKMAGLFAEPAVVLVKHNNPCGVGRGEDLAAAYRRALATDPVAAFGGILAANRPVDAALAEAVGDLFLEVMLAPGFAAEALDRLAAKKSLRLLACPVYHPASPPETELRSIAGGFLAQTADALADDPAGWTCPTRREPTPDERRGLDFAWRVCRYVKSNAIVVATPDQTVGIGAGQMSRVDSCRLAIEKAVLPVAGTVAASDAFFPFRDGLDTLAAAGVTAVVQPGGSRRDDEVIAAADEHGLAMLFTRTRHFRH